MPPSDSSGSRNPDLGPMVSVMQGADAASIEFLDDRPKTITWDELVTGGAAVGDVCNAGTEAFEPTVRLTGFGFTKAGVPIGDQEEVLVPTVARQPLSPGSCTPIRLMARDKQTAEGVDSGSYSGLLVVTSPQGGWAQRPITVGQFALQPAGDLKLYGQFSATHGEVYLRSDVLVFRPVNAETAANQLKANTKLGSLAHKGDIADVEVAQDASAVHGAVRVPVRVTAADGQGRFKGQLQVPGRPEPIAVEVVVADAWWLPALVLVAGVLAGLVARTITGRWAQLNRLWRARSRLAKQYQEATTAFKSHYSDLATVYTGPSAKDIAEFTADSKTVTNRLRKRTWTIDTSGSDYQQVAEPLEKAERDAEHLGSGTKEGFGSSILSLSEALDEFAQYLATKFPKTPKPAFVPFAAGLVTSEAGSSPELHRLLDVGGALAITEQADDYRKLMEQWCQLGDSLHRCLGWYDSVKRIIDQKQDAGQEKRLLDRARTLLIEVQVNLLEVRSQTDLEAFGIAGRLHRASTILGRL